MPSAEFTVGRKSLLFHQNIDIRFRHLSRKIRIQNSLISNKKIETFVMIIKRYEVFEMDPDFYNIDKSGCFLSIYNV